MNVQTHMSGQVSGQVPSQMPQQSGNPLQPQMQNFSGGMDADLTRARQFMLHRICTMLGSRNTPVTNEQKRKFIDVVKRLEDGLFKTAQSKEEYLNLETLEHRLQALIRRISSNHSQQPQQPANFSSGTTMIPTPGISHNQNANVISSSSVGASMISVNSSMTTTNVNTGSLLPTSGGLSMGINNGTFANGYQQSPASFSSGSGGNHVPSMGGQRMAGQMIPTPGFNSNNSQYSTSMLPGNSGGFSTVESTMVSQQQQKQHVGGLNNRGLHMGSGLRSGLQQKSIGFSNGALGSGLGMMENTAQFTSGPGTSEGYLTAAPYANSAKPFQQQFEQHQRPLMQSDAYGINNVESSGPGSLYSAVTSAGTLMNSQNVSSGGMQAISNANSSIVNNQSNFHILQQAANMNPQSFDHPEKMNFHSSLSSRDNSIQSQQQQQFYQQQNHLKMQGQQEQLMIKNNPFGQMQLASNLGTKIKTEPGLQQHGAVLQQVSDQFQQPEIQHQINTGDIGSRGANMDSTSSSQYDLCPAFSQGSQQMQQYHQQGTESQGDYGSFPAGAPPESVMQNQWHPQPQERIQGSVNTQEGSFQGRPVNNVSHPDKLSSDASTISQTIISRSKAEPHNSGTPSCRPINAYREQDFRNQQRWLLFLRHARRCSAPEGKCPENHCIVVQKLWKHMEGCKASPCAYPRCHASKSLINHNLNCKDLGCPVCVPFKSFCAKHQLKVKNHPGAGDASAGLVEKTATESNDVVQSSQKRAKIEQSLSPIPEEAKSALEVAAKSEQYAAHDVLKQNYHLDEISMSQKFEVPEVKIGASVTSSHGNMSAGEMNEVNIDDDCNQRPNGEHNRSDEHVEAVKQENLGVEEKKDAPKQANLTQVSENATGPKSGKPAIKGVSLTELFTPDQVREHIRGLRQWVGQSKAKAEKNQAMGHSMSENSCQLCAVEKLTFEPPPIYCSTCGARIKRNATYYTGGAGDTRHYFCIPCYNESRGDTIVVDGASIPKARLEKKKNDEETEEWWVQCDKCEAWQHQICALFNGRRNDGGQAEYTCPNCYIAEVERGERQPLPQNAVLGAKDLPQTFLSEHIERRLYEKLQEEKTMRAKFQGKSIDEIPEANELVVRVVSSVDKKLEVKPRFLEIFQEENYPTEFPYKSKVVLLFQRIEGVEVCLFGMYVQEFGSECAFPNQRRVYLSYLDSVKYFRPEVKAVTGEALRTFVYHEILIGYLEYCKMRGFTSCYIWACPPLKGEDYILYCHPEIQKTPKSDKLREWYLSMLRKASDEKIVVGLTNLYDHFFTQKGECKAKVTAARLPYFDGDYWPGAAEDLLYQIQQEEDGRKNNRKGLTKKTISKRALKASGQSDLSGNASKDLLLMHKLGETISPMREDFIMVHLQHCCTHCCILMVSGTRWVCPHQQCKNFQLCDKCYEVEKNREDRERHPVNHKDVHPLNPIEITDVSPETKDRDDILESEFFDTRQAFLSLCQGNHYQYDTLRRAKHSSMMVLYHLHNPTAPAFVTTCNVCHLDIEAGQGWRCEVCPDYDVCNACYQKDGGMSHPHKLTNHPSLADRDAQNKEARQLRVQQLRKMLELLVHASQCRSLQCQYPNCRKVKGLFRHGMQCKVRASGGCVLCKKMWYLLQLHARACKVSECFVPRCRDLREHLRRLQQQSDSRRRAAVNEMMRQRAAEVAGNV